MCVCVLVAMLLCSVSPPANESQVNVLLTCGLGFSSRPAPLNDSIGNLFILIFLNYLDTLHLSTPAYLLTLCMFPLPPDSLESHGVLLVWDSAMPRIKREFDEMRRTQAAYR